MAARNVKNNNPHNLRVSSVEQAKGFGWPGVVGIDQNGFAIFDTAANGELAGDQQRRVNSKQLNDQGNPFTVRDSLTKHVRGGGDDIPDNAVGFFERAGIDPDSTLADLDPNTYNQILAFSEGGAKDAFFRGVPSFAPGQDPRDAQARLTGDGNSTLPSFAPGQGVQTGTGQFGGVPPVLDQLAGREAEDDLRGVTLSPLDQQGSPADAGLMFPLGKDMDIVGNRSQLLSQDRAQFPAGSPQNYRDVQEGNVGSSFDVSMLKDILTQKEAAQEQGETPFIDVPGPSNDPGSYFLKGKEPDIQTQIEAGEQGAMIPQGKPVDILTKAQMGEGDGGFDLSKLLGALGSNAGLSALGIGAQGVGSLLEGRAQSKADKAAGKQQRTNNAIAAFTGGNAAQATPERASSTVGGLLKALGQGAGGFAQARQAQSNADRQFGLDERGLDQVDARTATLTEVERIRAAAKAAAAGGGAAGKLAQGNKGVQEQFGMVESTLDVLLKVHENGGIATGGAAIRLPSWFKGDIQTFMESMGNTLFGPLNEIHRLGRLSDKDLDILKKSVPTWGEGIADARAKAAALRTLISLRQKQFDKGTDLNTTEADPKLYAAILGLDIGETLGSKGGGSGKAVAKDAAKAAFDRGDLDEAERIMDEAGV